MEKDVIELKFDPDLVLNQLNLLPKINSYINELLLENQKLNLVSRETSNDDLKQLCAESVFPLTLINEQQPKFSCYLDIGSGGGLPSFPIMLGNSFEKSVLVERIGKKAAALSSIAQSLKLEKVELVNKTLEECKFETEFDLISMRLVKLTPQLLKKISKLMNSRSVFIYYFKPEFDVGKFGMSLATYSYPSGSKSTNKFFSLIIKK